MLTMLKPEDLRVAEIITLNINCKLTEGWSTGY